MGRLSRGVYRCVLRIIKWVYPRTEVVGAERLPGDPCVIVGNHAQIHGPITSVICLPGKHYTWCVAEMMHMKEVPAYAYRDFWSAKPKHARWFFRLASYAIAPLAVCIFTNAGCIGVYHDTRSLSTLRETQRRLEEGANIIIFPESYEPWNPILWKFQRGFVDVARIAYRRTGQSLRFVPMYVAPRLHKVVLGEPVTYDPTAPIARERERICDELEARITRMALELPEHIVVPYPNIPKRDYPRNTDAKEPFA